MIAKGVLGSYLYHCESSLETVLQQHQNLHSNYLLFLKWATKHKEIGQSMVTCGTQSRLAVWDVCSIKPVHTRRDTVLQVWALLRKLSIQKLILKDSMSPLYSYSCVAPAPYGARNPNNIDRLNLPSSRISTKIQTGIFVTAKQTGQRAFEVGCKQDTKRPFWE